VRELLDELLGRGQIDAPQEIENLQPLLLPRMNMSENAERSGKVIAHIVHRIK